METKHTFLFTDGNWKVKGFYFDENEKSYLVEGEIKTKQDENLWALEGLMKSVSDDAIELKNNCDIIPFKEKRLSTNWTGINPAIGKLRGSYLIQGEYLISLFESEDQEHSGSEYLIYLNDSRYRYRGVIFAGNKKLSSWTVELERL